MKTVRLTTDKLVMQAEKTDSKWRTRRAGCRDDRKVEPLRSAADPFHRQPHHDAMHRIDLAPGVDGVEARLATLKFSAAP